MALCDLCANYSRDTDQFRQQYDDIDDGNRDTHHYCPMYDDNIDDVFYRDAPCALFLKGAL